MRTNTLFYWTNALGEAEIIDAINVGLSYETLSRLIPITNPALRFLIGTTKIQGKHLKNNFSVNVPYSDHLIFNFVGALLKQVGDDITASPNFKEELKRSLLGIHEGPFLSAKNELTVAAYYKGRGYEIKLSSSRESGLPDVILTSEPISSDAKLFPDKRLQLRATVNESGDAIQKCFSGICDSVIVLMLLNPSKSKFVASLNELAKVINEPSFRHYRDDDLIVMPMGNEYEAGDIRLSVVNQNLSLNFQASWPMDGPVEDFKNSIIKSVAQSTKAKKKSITWIEATGSANRYAMEMQLLRHVVGTEDFVRDQPNLEGLVIYSVEPAEDGKNRRAAFAVDVYGQGAKKMGIDKDSVTEFLKSCATLREVLIP